MPKQVLVALLLLLIMAGGVAWIAFVLVKAVPFLGRVYGMGNLMKRRSDLLKHADQGPLSEDDFDKIQELTGQMREHVQGETAKRLVEQEVELAAAAKAAAADGNFESARTLLSGLRRTWP
jgi:hypothetical protein